MKKKELKSIPLYYLFPILIIISIVPLIVHLKVIHLDEVSYRFWNGEKDNADFFSYYKAVVTIIFSAISLLLFILANYKGIIKIKQLMLYYIPIAVYTLAVIISTAASKYPTIAGMGFADRYEGAYTLLSYLVILFVTINFVSTEKHIKFILAGLFVSAFILGAIGVFQFFGMDFLQSNLARVLLLPSEYKNLSLSFKFGAGTIYSTLYNTNYVGSYMAMLLPLSFAAYLYVKHTGMKIVMGIFSCLMFANWIGCRSRTGYLAVALSALLLLVLLRKSIVKNIKTIIPLLLSFVIIFIGMNSYVNGQLLGRAKSIVKVNNASQTKPRALLNDIVFSDKMVSIIYGQDTLNIQLEGNQVSFKDTGNSNLQISNDSDGNITFKDDRYSDYKIFYDNTDNIFKVKLSNMNFNLYITPEGFRLVGGKGALVNKINHAEHYLFEGKETYASGRGFIWSRAIVLLKKNIIIGGGPDTFVAQFPQDDYIGKLRGFGEVGTIVDKPHNMYLQIGINTGVVSLIAFILLMVFYSVSSFKLYLKSDSNIKLIGAAVFSVLIAYAFAGLANDSVISVAPVFWILLGIGISCNYIVEATPEKLKNISVKVK